MRVRFSGDLSHSLKGGKAERPTRDSSEPLLVHRTPRETEGNDWESLAHCHGYHTTSCPLGQVKKRKVSRFVEAACWIAISENEVLAKRNE
jgi:hypothetical protein